jgi:hypothetical protein
MLALAMLSRPGIPLPTACPKPQNRSPKLALNHDPLPRAAFQRPQLRCIYYNEAG